jgi:glycosyltransferase involved in cell wall biosynthesis
MKILMVSRWLWDERRRNGNQPGFFGELARALVAQGLDLTILSQADGAGPTPERRPVDGLNLHVFSRSGRRPLLALFDKLIKPWAGYRKAVTDAATIRRFVRRHGPFDAVIAQCEEPDGIACALATLLGDFPPLLTAVHDLRYQFRSDGIRYTYQSSLGFVFAQSNRVIANSDLTSHLLQDEYGVPEEKIGQCRIHLTAPFLALAATPAPPQNPADVRILFLGALNRKKAPDVFLRAAKLLAAEIPAATFVLVGAETSDDEDFRALLENLAAEPTLAHRLEITGRLDPADVIAQIHRAQVVVCPSRIESFSRTTIEALALDRPVIVTETTGAAQWVRETGCGSVVAPDNPRALADAIREWSQRKDVPDASARITSELTATRAAEDWLRELKVVVEGSPAESPK